jgi:hypothetical protein
LIEDKDKENKMTNTLKLNQVLAIDGGVRNKAKQELTALHRSAEKPELYNGLTRVYQPKDEEGEKFPPERQVVQLRAADVLKKLQATLMESYDTELTKDAGNLVAVADVKVDGRVLVPNAPVSFLLYLEKQLEDLNTFVSKMPVLDSAEEWTFDPGQLMYRSTATVTTKTKKVMKPVVMYEATDKHPAQVKEVTEDVVVGNWHATKFSAALRADEKALLLDRLDRLRKAVKFAREEANSVVVEKKEVAETLFSFLLNK